MFSRKPSHLERARREFRVGNLYLNRGITGALVGRQPFGGFGLSGTGTQAGGPEYLLHFVEPRVCCENTLRAAVPRQAAGKLRAWPGRVPAAYGSPPLPLSATTGLHRARPLSWPCSRKSTAIARAMFERTSCGMRPAFGL